MISSTSITSTSGVVLMAETTSSSSSEEPTLMAMAVLPAAGRSARRRHGGADLRAHEHAVQLRAEATHRLHRHLVAAHEPVVAEHRGHGDRQADGGHDERLADGAGDLVDRRLTGDADGGQRMVDAPHGAEQADERR